MVVIVMIVVAIELVVSSCKRYWAPASNSGSAVLAAVLAIATRAPSW